MNQKLSFNSLYFQLSTLTEKFGVDWLRVALAIVFIWFGFLKIIGMSPAHDLVEKQSTGYRPRFLYHFLEVGRLQWE